jgi:hypothetical protein
MRSSTTFIHVVIRVNHDINITSEVEAYKDRLACTHMPLLEQCMSHLSNRQGGQEINITWACEVNYDDCGDRADYSCVPDGAKKLLG